MKVKLSAFYALGRKRAPYTDLAPLIQHLFEAFGPKRLMWASDSPFQVQDGHRYAPSIASDSRGTSVSIRLGSRVAAGADSSFRIFSEPSA